MSAFKDFLADFGPIFTTEHWLEVADPTGEVRRVQAFATEEYAARDVNAQRAGFLKERSLAGALLVLTLSRSVTHSAEERAAAALKGTPLGDALFFKFWIVDDESLETQLEMLSVLGYPFGVLEPERLAGCREILRKIHSIRVFKIWTVNPGVGAVFGKRLSDQEATEIAEMVQPFHIKNGENMYNTVKSHARGIRNEFMM